MRFLESHAGVAVIIFFSLVALATFNDYGMTWDESVQAHYGELVINYFVSGFHDQRCNEFLNLHLYGPLFESLCALVYSLTGLPPVEVRHFMIACCSVMTAVAVLKIARLFSRPLVPLFSVLSLLMLPRFYGHAFNNSKDIPFACAFAWAMYALCNLLSGRTAGWRPYIACGTAIGMALSVRVGALILFFYLIAGLLAAIVMKTSFGRDRNGQIKVPAILVGTCSAVLSAWFFMVVFWPWMHGNPILRPFEVFQATTAFQKTYPVFFEGTMVNSASLPLYYLPKYLLITTPFVIICSASLGLSAMVLFILRKAENVDGLLATMIILWFFLPIIFALVKHPNIYDGIRHFIFILPALALISGYGAATVVRYISRRIRKFSITAVLVMMMLLLPMKDLLLLHPYQMTYFNMLAGGISKAWKSYETDYWVSSYKEAAEWVNRKALENPEEHITVVLAANSYSGPCAAYYLRPEISLYTLFTGLEKVPQKFHYYVSTTRYGLHRRYADLPVEHVIGRQGAVFCVIKRGPAWSKKK